MAGAGNADARGDGRQRRDEHGSACPSPSPSPRRRRRRRRRSVRRAGPPVPARVAGALLPHPRFASGRRGRAAGHPVGGLAGPARLRSSRLSADLAVPGSRQPLPQRASHGQPAPAGRLAFARGRPTAAHPAWRSELARTLPRRTARRARRHRPRPRCQVRSHRSHRPGVHHRSPSPATPPRRRPHPA